MRVTLAAFSAIALLGVTACGTTKETTTVIVPSSEGSTVVVPADENKTTVISPSDPSAGTTVIVPPSKPN